MCTKFYNSRRDFLKAAGYAAGAAALGSVLPTNVFAGVGAKQVTLSGHLWVYASKYPPDWDCTPIMETVFSDFKYVGLEGVEVMESSLRNKGAVPLFKELIQKYKLPLTGACYYGDMWDKGKKQYLLDDISLVVEKLGILGASTFGITVGDAHHVKTEDELDAQADVLLEVLKICDKNKIQGNLHNHTFEVENGLHDLKGTLKRIPDIKLGPDINWLIRGGVDPVDFIDTYGHQMVYMHLRDQHMDGKWTEYLGQGVTEFTEIAKALKRVDFKGRAAIELAFDAPPINLVRDDWKKSRKFVGDVFGW